MVETLFDIPGASSAKLDGTAATSDVLNGKTFYSKDQRSKLTGSMPNHGAVSKSITPSMELQSVPIAKGYHNGNGKINVNAIVGDMKTMIKIGNGSNHETFELIFDLQSQNKIHVCFSTFWAKGNFSVYGLKNGTYQLLTTQEYGDSHETIGVFVDLTGIYENIKIVVTRDEIFNESCRYAVTVSTI